MRHKINDEIAHFRLLVRLQLITKRSDRQESFVMIFIVGGETSDVTRVALRIS